VFLSKIGIANPHNLATAKTTVFKRENDSTTHFQDIVSFKKYVFLLDFFLKKTF